MKISTELLLQAKTLISFGLRPQQIKALTGVSGSRSALLVKELQDEGHQIKTKGSLSANKILRTKNHYRQFSLWMVIYKAILSSESDFHRKKLAGPWYNNTNSNVLLKTQAVYVNLLQDEFNLNLEKDEFINASECFSILQEIALKQTTYLVNCEDCGLEYVVIESSKQTDNCPFCHERFYANEKERIDSIYAQVYG